jgi:hypothetical protein
MSSGEMFTEGRRDYFRGSPKPDAAAPIARQMGYLLEQDFFRQLDDQLQDFSYNPSAIAAIRSETRRARAMDIAARIDDPRGEPIPWAHSISMDGSVTVEVSYTPPRLDMCVRFFVGLSAAESFGLGR